MSPPASAAATLLGGLGRQARHLGPRRALQGGRLLGDLRRVTAPREARTVAANLAWLGLDRLRDTDLVAATYQAFGVFVMEFIVAQGLSAEAVAARWNWSGLSHLQRLAGGRAGWILAGAHTGNWELLAALGPLLGRRIVAPAETQFHPLLSQALKDYKRRWGLVSLDPRASMRPLLAALDRGDLVALPLDGGSFRAGVPVRLLGRALRIAPGAARLACLSGRPILPVFARRTGFLEQEISIGAPLWPLPISRATPGGPRQTGRGCSASGSARVTARLAQQAADRLGAHLQRTPGEWCIFRPVERAGDRAPPG